MIVRLKRLTLLCLAQDRDETLEALRELGVVHVADLRHPEGEALDALRARLGEARRALSALPEEPAVTAGGADGAPSPLAGRDAAVLVAEVLAALAERSASQERADGIRHELERLDGFGEFDLEAVRALEQAGVEALLGTARAAATLTAPDDVLLVPLGRDRESRRFVLVARGATAAEPPDLGAPYTIVPWPARPLAQLRAELATAGEEQARLAQRLASLAAGRPVVADHAAQVAEAVRFAEVRAGMEEADSLVLLGGWVPVGDCDALQAAAARQGWGVVLDDPRPGEDVPTLLHHSPWVRPVRTVLDFLHIYPGYWEADVGWVFLPFFTLFFAMIVGDAGYAALLLVLTVVLQRRLKTAPRYAFHMMYMAGFATLFWGVINGSYFGIPSLPSPLAGLQVPWIKDRDNLIDLCFFIGAVHLTIAHVWNALTHTMARETTKTLAQGGWLLVVWSMFFLARQTVLGREMPGFMLYVLIAGVALVIVFMKTLAELKESWIDHALLPLTLIGNFVDILSYIRLFAVGYASIAVLAAFNGMAADIGFDSIFTAVAASLLLLFANALNIVLCGLGVLVHAVRLNTLEFSTHKGLSWAGYNLFTPFAHRREAAR